MSEAAKERAAMALVVLLGLAACLVFACVVLFATGWASLLPDPIWHIAGIVAAVGVAAWILFVVCVCARELWRARIGGSRNKPWAP